MGPILSDTWVPYGQTIWGPKASAPKKHMGPIWVSPHKPDRAQMGPIITDFHKKINQLALGIIYHEYHREFNNLT